MSHDPVSTYIQHGEFVGVSCAKCSQLGAGINQADPALCAQHGKDRIFFCLNCFMHLCFDCVSHGQALALHHVDNVAAVYGEKLSEVVKSILGMQPGTAVCARNLEVLEKEEVDDLRCDLIPPYWFAKLIFPGFPEAVDTSFLYTMNSACDVVWDVVVTKSSKVEIELTPRDAEIGKFRHKVVVLIPHPEYTKVIRNTFEVKGISNTCELVEASHVMGNDKGNLEVSVGIHPVDAVVEKRLLNYQYQKLKAKNAGTERQLATITNEFGYKYHTMNFKMYIWKMDMEPEWYSQSIVDDENRQWCLNLTYQQSYKIEAYVQLVRGSATNCRFFIQMIHENSGKSILKMTNSFFYQDDSYGWNHFITWNALIDDKGFYPDDNVRFSFGVRPLPV